MHITLIKVLPNYIFLVLAATALVLIHRVILQRFSGMHVKPNCCISSVLYIIINTERFTASVCGSVKKVFSRTSPRASHTG